MRMECMNHKYVYESPLQVGRLVNNIADSKQLLIGCWYLFNIFLEHYYKERNRPYGVGLLVIGHDVSASLCYFLLISFLIDRFVLFCFDRLPAPICFKLARPGTCTSTRPPLLAHAPRVHVPIWSGTLRYAC